MLSSLTTVWEVAIAAVANRVNPSILLIWKFSETEYYCLNLFDLLAKTINNYSKECLAQFTLTMTILLTTLYVINTNLETRVHSWIILVIVDK